MNIRDKVKSKSDLRTSTMDIPEWEVTLGLREMTLMSRAECRSVLTQGKKPTPQQDAAFSALIVITHTFDPETGKPVFEASDLDLLTSANPKVMDNITTAIYELSGLIDDDPVAEAAKNSGTTPISETSSN